MNVPGTTFLPELDRKKMTAIAPTETFLQREAVVRALWGYQATFCFQHPLSPLIGR
jgi:hypothetical protein